MMTTPSNTLLYSVEGGSTLFKNQTLIQQRMKAFFMLIAFHLFIIAASNYLVQFALTIPPITVGSFTTSQIETTWGSFTFPFIFLATDLTVRLFGSVLARRIVFYVMFPALIISYVISIIFAEGTYQGFAGLSTFDTFVGRIALASFTAYCVGQLLDITVFNKLRQNKHWWIAPSVSTILGNLIDAFLFFFIAFYKSADPLFSENWFNFGVVDYMTRIVINGLFFLPLYGVLLAYLLRKLKRLDTV